MEVKAKAIKNIFSEATEEQVNAISKLVEKQANMKPKRRPIG